MDTRIESLLKSLERNHHRFKETFIDEDTGEEVTVDRDEVVEFDTTEEERELMESIIADVAHLSDEDLETFRANTAWFWPRHFDEFYLELIRRGDEEHGIFIHHKEARFYYDLGQITSLLLQRQTMASLCSTPSAILSRI